MNFQLSIIDLVLEGKEDSENFWHRDPFAMHKQNGASIRGGIAMSLLKKGVLVGIGLLSYAGDKIGDISKEMMKKTEGPQAEARKAVEGLMATGQQKKEDLQKTAAERLRKKMQDMGMATKEDLQKLEERIAALEGKNGLPPRT